jgi:hypothetical protein
VYKLTDTGATSHWSAHVRERPQEIGVIEESVAKTFGGGRKVGPGVFEDVFEIR